MTARKDEHYTKMQNEIELDVFGRVLFLPKIVTVYELDQELEQLELNAFLENY